MSDISRKHPLNMSWLRFDDWSLKAHCSAIAQFTGSKPAFMPAVFQVAVEGIAAFIPRGGW